MTQAKDPKGSGIDDGKSLCNVPPAGCRLHLHIFSEGWPRTICEGWWQSVWFEWPNSFTRNVKILTIWSFHDAHNVCVSGLCLSCPWLMVLQFWTWWILCPGSTRRLIIVVFSGRYPLPAYPVKSRRKNIHKTCPVLHTGVARLVPEPIWVLGQTHGRVQVTRCSYKAQKIWICTFPICPMWVPTKT